MGLTGNVYRASHRGFQTVEWQEGPFIYAVVSDPDEVDLLHLVEKLRHK